MNQFVWKEAFNIGLADIDQHHRELLALLNTLEEDSTKQKSPGINQIMFDQLKLYARKHFKLEEKLMEDTFYPEIKKQRQLHAYFESELSKMESYREKIAPERMFAFIREWFLQHILDEDVKFANYLK